MDIRENADFILALQEAKANLNEMIEGGKLIAEMNKNYYDALLKQGFTEEQALVLTSKQGLSLHNNE